MLPRERVYAALAYQKPDIIPQEISPTHIGVYEHGEKMRQLFGSCLGDFGEEWPETVPLSDKNNFDQNGEYHEFRKDEWETVWEHRIYLMHGQPVKVPLDNIDDIYKYRLPCQSIPPVDSKDFIELKRRITLHKKKYFFKAGWVGIFEKMIALRKFEDVLMDIVSDTTGINKLADMITDYHAEDIQRLIKADVDAIQFGDDYGTQHNMIMSPELWRRFFKPRLARLMQPIKQAGKKILFHSCGYIQEILEDLKEIGVDAIWPQLTVYDMKQLAQHCRSIGLAVAIHIDRAHIMTHGSPDEVRRAVEAAFEVFRPDLGGAWFYVEIDNGFPFENIEALVKAISKYR
jgi:hypothetical protein